MFSRLVNNTAKGAVHQGSGSLASHTRTATAVGVSGLKTAASRQAAAARTGRQTRTMATEATITGSKGRDMSFTPRATESAAHLPATFSVRVRFA
jgi:hypothetical protein